MSHIVNHMAFLSEEDACVSVLVENLEKEASQDGGGRVTSLQAL